MFQYVEFFEAPAFTRHVGTYLNDAGLLALQLFLSDQPEAGQIMPGNRWISEAAMGRRDARQG